MLIGSDVINEDTETYFIAEIGSNFDGSIERAWCRERKNWR